MATDQRSGTDGAGGTGQNHYDVLGLDRRASSDDVRAAYRLRSHMFHPDKYENYPEPLRSQLLAEAAKEFKKLTQAYDTLRDPSRRAAHDRQLDAPWGGHSRAAGRASRAPAAPPRRASAAAPGRTTVRDASDVDEEERRRAQREERARKRAEAAAEPPRPRERDPMLVVRPGELDFGALALGATKQLPLKIANAGGRTLFGEITSNRSWLSVNRRSFVSSSTLVLVQADTNGLRAGEEYAGALVVSTLNGGDQLVPVSLRVSGKPEPLLAGAPSLLDFGTAESGSTKTRTVRLTNAGTGTLIGSVVTRGDWLSVSESRFRANEAVFEVIARTAGLPAGEHQGEVLVLSNGGQAKVQVLLQVAAGTGMAARGAARQAADDELGNGVGSNGRAGAAAGGGESENGVPRTAPVAELNAEERQALLKRIVQIEPETTFERDFLRRIVHLVRAGEHLAPGELAKIYELEARKAAQET
jgi:curved DNA-binding protein CbpA